jgi:hypothetical protein
MSKLTEEKVREIREERTEERYSLRAILTDFFYNLIHINRKSFFFTAWQLTVHPGISIRKVIQGYRKYLFEPLEYLVFMGAVIIILTTRYHFYSNDLSATFSQLVFLSGHKKFLKDFFDYAEQYATLINVISIPVFTLVCRIFYNNSVFNTGEMLVMNTYITAQQMFYLLAMAPLFEFFPGFKDFILPFYSIIAMLYNGWVYVLFFEEKGLGAYLKAFFVVLVSYLIQFPVNLIAYFGEPVLKYINF